MFVNIHDHEYLFFYTFQELYIHASACFMTRSVYLIKKKVYRIRLCRIINLLTEHVCWCILCSKITYLELILWSCIVQLNRCKFWIQWHSALLIICDGSRKKVRTCVSKANTFSCERQTDRQQMEKWSFCVCVLVQVTQRWYAPQQLPSQPSFIACIRVTKDACPMSVFLSVAVQNIQGIKWCGERDAWETKTASFKNKNFEAWK